MTYLNSNIKILTKAETLVNLKNRVKYFKIPKTYFFNVKDWKNNKKIILKKIEKEFKDKIIIRSSTSKEDSLSQSNAGKFVSFLNIKKKNKKNISRAIHNIIKSYKLHLKKIDQEQILVQEMIIDAKMSGVIFTGNNKNGNFYYTINYDDVTGSTDTVTSGKTEFSNKTLFILKKRKDLIRSKRFKKIIKGVKELENIFKNINLDIEFAQNASLDLYLFQVRPVVNLKGRKLIKFKKIEIQLKKEKEKLLKIFNKKEREFKKIKTILSQMSDWNPAEMIGQMPSELSFSLYKLLITNKSWLRAREIMGYKSFKNTNLMYSIFDRPYIDVSKSLMSLIPKKVNTYTTKKLINASINKLMHSPSNHDKIEFELLPTCYCFDFENRIKKINAKLTPLEIKKLKLEYKKIFYENLQSIKKGSIDNNLKKIYELKIKQEKLNLNDGVESLSRVINECINYGVIPFSILARHAFISKEILNSLSRKKLITEIDKKKFENSIQTVTSSFLEDLKQLSLKNYSKFVKIYGHLRPGTYDIKSKRYDKTDKNIFLKNTKINLKSKKKKQFSFNPKVTKALKKILKKEKINITPLELLNYIKRGVQGREYAKFVFTKSISFILEKLKLVSKKHNLSLKDFENLNINEILENTNKKNFLKRQIEKNTKKRDLNNSINIPEIIVEPNNVFIGASVVSVPNFVTYSDVTADSVIINNKDKNFNLKGKIVLIESADPGYDWIFAHGIKGLITKYGGVNSHMAIRCTELNIPAAIGCGENLYKKLINCKSINLNCKNFVVKDAKN